MADDTQVPWSQEQWARVSQVVREEARAARVAAHFLPRVGPLGQDVRYVPRETLRSSNAGLSVDDTETVMLSTLQIKVFLQTSQMADPALTSAMFVFRRAANILAHLEDEIVFKGQPGAGQLPPRDKSRPGDEPYPAEVQGGETMPGLVAAAGDNQVSPPNSPPKTKGAKPPRTAGDELVRMVSHATGQLERRHHPGPFACVLGDGYFEAVHTPTDALTLPQDRILPFLGGGPLVRSSALAAESGLVIALSGAPIDLVIATDISLEFLQVAADASYVFRLYEKMALRIKEPSAIQRLSVSPAKKRAG